MPTEKDIADYGGLEVEYSDRLDYGTYTVRQYVKLNNGELWSYRYDVQPTANGFQPITEVNDWRQETKQSYWSK